MTKAIANLPSESNKLTRHILTLQNEIERLRHQVKTLTQEKELLDSLLKQARQARFSRKTERFDITQLSLLDEDMDVDISTLETKLGASLIDDVPSKKDVPYRQPLPESLPREEIRLEPPSSCCPDCGQALRFVRDEINEVLDYIPGKFIVRKTVRPQYGCGGCQTIHSAQLPAQLIDKAQVAPGLLTQIIINKCVDHLPLYRQQKIFQRAGIDLPISTLCDWMGKTGVALEPLVDRMHALLSEQKVLHADETPMPLLSAKKGKSTRGYLWAYATPATAEKRIVIFDCQPGRSAQYVRSFLRDFSGTLMVDDYAGYKGLFVSGQIKEAGCLAHVRRKFFEQYQTNQNPLAKTALDSIGELYKLERLIKERPPDKKYQWRQRYARPILDTLQRWLEIQQRQTAPNSGMHKAISHALKRWPALLTYLDDGNIPIDNNHIENCIRPIAVGRKNWLFAGSLQAGQRMAGIMSLLHTAKLNGIDPFNWLHSVLRQLPTWKNSRLDELLPFDVNSFV